MGRTRSYREISRSRLRDDLITAARELTVARGWESVRMADVAEAAGVSRQTVYNEFDGKAGLAEAMAAREIERFAAAVKAQLAAHQGDPLAAGHAAILHVLDEGAENPLVRAILTGSHGAAGELLPFLTTRADILLACIGAVVRDWATAQQPGIDEQTVAVAADSIIRLTISHLMLPLAPRPRTAAMLSDVLIRLLR